MGVLLYDGGDGFEDFGCDDAGFGNADLVHQDDGIDFGGDGV